MTNPVCPCETVEHPQQPSNPPGRNAIDYRVGAFSDFRAALLHSLRDVFGTSIEHELQGWRPSAQSDLALQLVEWFAYLADILTFYNERVANESYLGTATQTESLRRLIGVLGYRPRPGIAATGQVAAMANSRKSFTVPAGFQIQSKPGPGQEPQIFEVDTATVVQPISAVAVDPPAKKELTGFGDTSVLLAGTVIPLAPGDFALLLPRSWPADPTFALHTVLAVDAEKNPRGKSNTRITFTAPVGMGVVDPDDYQLFYSTESAKLYPYPAVTVITDTDAVFDTVRRSATAGDKVLFHALGSQIPDRLAVLTGTAEVIYYANTPEPANDPTKPPPEPSVPVPIPATRIFYDMASVDAYNAHRGATVVRFGWREAGRLIAAPATGLTTDAGGGSLTLSAAPGASFPAGTRLALLEDAAGDGLAATGQTLAGGAALRLSDLPKSSLSLTPPLTALLNTLPVSRGKTVAREVLGSGDATRQWQEFVLKKAPLTYLADGAAASGAGYRSTLRVWVSGVEWREQPSFYAQPADARIFVTREDDEAKTHVLFGDGVNGARLPSGEDNVVAMYRYGSGGSIPDAGALTVVLQPLPGLQAIRNPVPAGGGADPDPADRIKQYAPQSVTTFGRAISGLDYETLAAQTPGVDRARAYWRWDLDLQRTVVAVYVGDTLGAVQAARTALAGAADPNRQIVVNLAAAVPLRLALTLVVNAAVVPAAVAVAVREALLDERSGLFGHKTVRIGQALFRSQIYSACLAVPGVMAVHNLEIVRLGLPAAVPMPGPRLDPGEGMYFRLSADELHLSTEVAPYA